MKLFLKIEYNSSKSARPKMENICGTVRNMNLQNIKIKSFMDNRLGYRGEIGVILINLSGEDQVISPGEKIAQLVLARVEYCNLIEAEFISKNTDRGDTGYGDSGRF